MPEKVPFYLLISQLIRRIATGLKTLARGLLVVLVWLIILPNFTLWTWRFYFWSGESIVFFRKGEDQPGSDSSLTTITDESSYFSYEILNFSFRNFLSDCLEGQIITGFVIIIFVAAYLFREWVMQNLPAEQQAPLNEPVPVNIENPNNNEHLVQEQVAIDTLLTAMQVINPEGDEDQDMSLHRLEHQLGHLRAAVDNELAQRNDDPTDTWYNQHASSSSANDTSDEEDDEEDRLPELVDNNPRFNNAAIERMFQEQMERRRELARIRELEQVEEIPPMIQPRQPAAAAAVAGLGDDDEPFDVGDDINGVLEAIGMRGNPWMLVQNSVLMSLMISLCLGIAVWVPYVIGRLVILIQPISFIETPIYVMRLITDPLVDFVLDLCFPYIWSLIGGFIISAVPESIQLALKSIQDQFSKGVETAVTLSNETITRNETVVNNMTRAGSDSLMMNMDWVLIQNKIEAMSAVALARWHRFGTGQTGLDRSMCILVGYLVLITLGSWYLNHGRRASNSSRNTTGETIQDIIRQQGIFLKVLFFIVIELVVFPTVCGFLLDMATLPLFVNASFTSRYLFHLKSPYSSYFLHWFLGTGVLFYFAIFITVCREIIRPGVMWFIRDPNDPQFHPVQEMVERPLPNLLHKISQSALIYSVMLVFGVGTVTYTLGYTGIVFPLRLPFNTPLSTLAIDLLIIQFLLPPLIALIKPRDYSKKALDLWWHFACRQLRLTSFMFNVRKPDEEGRHIRKTLKSKIFFEKATIPTDEFSDVSIDEDDQKSVVFKRDGMMVRVPKYDSVPVDPKRRMLVPVDPVTLEALDEEERIRGHPAAADTNDEAQSTIVVYIPPNFKRRIIIFLFSMWFSISLFSCSVTVVPLLVGRALFKYYLAPGSKVNDLYSFALGIYIMAGLGTMTHWINECYATYKTNEYNNDEIMTYMKEKTKKIAKFLYLSSMFGLVIPLLFGIAVDLFVFMPIRSFNSESGLVIYVTQNWSFGVAYMSIIHNIIHVLPANNSVRRKLIGLVGDGIMQTDVWNITRTVIVPVIVTALLAITIPGIASWGILRFLDPKDPSLQITVTRYTYPIIFFFFVGLLSIVIFKKLIHLWIQIVKEDLYGIGVKLHNRNNESSDEPTTLEAEGL
ncbi:uncharacterized protein EV154DRAFT_535463 [Mucor mucedo]|uniref:uncharacterized protein n=1 Tax=Mucor mucedo TaxID=29922 RepID=UPI002220D093|nr:uncharacterized protein EV154DRAFT_535463 [Mucor mucedo]KAI7896747.1 hypothetical protein EV154DRAFT_535463 [Mucor mucedo]